MNELDSLKLGFQSLSSDVQMLSQTVRTAASNMSNAGNQAMGQVQQASGRAQGMAVQALPQSMYAQSPAFMGQPMGVPYGAMAPLNTGKRNNVAANVYYGTFNNEYNRPANWFRDVLAGAGHEFVDTKSEDAKRYAARNWDYRMKMGKHDAIGTALYFTPGVGLPLGLAYDYIAKPMLQEGDKRRYEYWNFLDRTGARNVDARLGANPRGGFTDDQKKTLAAEVQGAWKGTGFKKTQWDELVQLSEQSGYFKTMDKASVDSFKSKFDQLAKDAKYAMQTLHTTTEETAKIMGDINKMSGSKPGSTAQINQLNTAAAYTGLSPMQMHEFAQGRSGMFKSMGSTETAGYTAALREITNIIKNTPTGKKPDVDGVIGFADKVYEEAKSNPTLSYAMSWVMDANKQGGLTVNKKRLDEFLSSDYSPAEMVKMARDTKEKFTPAQWGMIARGEHITEIEGNSGLSPDKLRLGIDRKEILRYLDEKNPTNDPQKMEARRNGVLTNDEITMLAAKHRMTQDEIVTAMKSTNMMDRNVADRFPGVEKENINAYLKLGNPDKKLSLLDKTKNFMTTGYTEGAPITDKSLKLNTQYDIEKKRWGSQKTRLAALGKEDAFSLIASIDPGDAMKHLKAKDITKIDEALETAIGLYEKTGDVSGLYDTFGDYSVKLKKGDTILPGKNSYASKYIYDTVYRRTGKDLMGKMYKYDRLTQSEQAANTFREKYREAGVDTTDERTLGKLDDAVSKIMLRNVDFMKNNPNVKSITGSDPRTESVYNQQYKDINTAVASVGYKGGDALILAKEMNDMVELQRNSKGILSLKGLGGTSVEAAVEASAKIQNSLTGAVNDLTSGANTQTDINQLTAQVLQQMLTKLEQLNAGR